MSGVAFVLSLVALLLSVVALARASRVKKVAVPVTRAPDLKCGCGHHLAVHDPESGTCNDQIWIQHYDRELRMNMERRHACRCKQYTGDRPVDTFFTPRIVT